MGLHENINLNPIDVTPGSDKSIHWLCPNGHSWISSTVRRITDKKTCMVCSSLGFRHPLLLDEWDYEKNGELDPKEIHAGSSTKVWWKCSFGHQWNTRIHYRTGVHKSNCPICARKIAAEKTRLIKLSKSGSLQDHFPEIADKWNKTLNGDLSPNSISSNSHSLFWWNCSCGNSYKQTPNNLVTLFKRGSKFQCEKCT